MSNLFDIAEVPQRLALVPRDYQIKDHDESFRLWDSGIVGVLTRAATGSGKTPMSCLKADTWLRRGDNYKVMVVSYEKDLVWQFAQEIEDFLDIVPGIEMESEAIDADKVPQIVVASRQTLLPHVPPTPEQVADLEKLGVINLGACHKNLAARYLKFLRQGNSADRVIDDLIDRNNQPEAVNGVWSRLHKFDWRFNWLIFFDEAHRHAYRLPSVKHIVDWFEQNPMSRRSGMTATPRRGDGVSIGEKMFPGIAIDYPLYHPKKLCSVKDGWAVPYIQKYIEVQGVDFKSIFKIKDDFKQAEELERQLGSESALAAIVGPLLDLVGDRSTLIFSPGVQMAKDVANFINARSEAVCPTCNTVGWFPKRVIGDGAQCKCGEFITSEHVTKGGEQAVELDGSHSKKERRQAYDAHREGRYQFLSVCGLCREGYNSVGIACVALFRPVSKAARSLAEQMKGRGCRPSKDTIKRLNQISSPEERVKAIAESDKPNCLVVDLVGASGLEDFATTLQIYAEGLPDEVVEKAQKLIDEGEEDIQEAIETAEKQIAADKERIAAERIVAERKAREDFERRAAAQAEVRYTAQDVGYGSNVTANPGGASPGQMNFIRSLGMDVQGASISKSKAGIMISLLQSGVPPDGVATRMNIGAGQWKPCGPSIAQLNCLSRIGISKQPKTRYEASDLISAKKEPAEFEKKKVSQIENCRKADELTFAAKSIAAAKELLSPDVYQRLISAGKAKREKMDSNHGRYSWE